MAHGDRLDIVEYRKSLESKIQAAFEIYEKCNRQNTLFGCFKMVFEMDHAAEVAYCTYLLVEECRKKAQNLGINPDHFDLRLK